MLIERGLFSRCTALFLLSCIVFLFPVSAAAMSILIGTGEVGSFSHFVGRTICRTIDSRLTDIDCKALPGPDDLHNLTNLQIGSLDMVLVDSRTLHDAISQSGQFRFLDISYVRFRALARLYEVPAMLVARSDAGIPSLDSLTGKRINMGSPGSLRNRLFSAIMEAKGWTREDFSLVEELSSSQAVDSMAFCHGTIQAMLHIGVHPDAQLNQLIRLCDAQLIDTVDQDTARVIQDHAAYSRVGIAAGTYPSQDRTVFALGTRVMLVASEDFGEPLAYRIIGALADARRRIESAHPALAAFDERTAAGDELGIPLHPGVSRYLKEQGF